MNTEFDADLTKVTMSSKKVTIVEGGEPLVVEAPVLTLTLTIVGPDARRQASRLAAVHGLECQIALSCDQQPRFPMD